MAEEERIRWWEAEDKSRIASVGSGPFQLPVSLVEWRTPAPAWPDRPHP